MKNVPAHASTLLLVLAFGLGPALAIEEFSGDIRFFIDGAGRAVLLVDSDAGGAPDGHVDEVFLLARETAISQSFDVDGQDAAITFTGDRVLVDTADGSLHIDLAIGTPAPAGTGRTTYRILDGVELVHRPEPNSALMNSFGTGDIGSGLLTGWLDPLLGGGADCIAGGRGAKSCSLSGHCSVSCGSGFYACCNTISDGGCACRRAIQAGPGRETLG